MCCRCWHIRSDIGYDATPSRGTTIPSWKRFCSYRYHVAREQIREN
ncbi:hypothetical protein ASZ90_015720 [hydrocarbon metagenome]|uniref:Uncharacterized protein n=1 Tax=hydrocarbon metagenome TaxID=938273 RepID=A0A0W8F152_9ZZZZ